MRIAFYGDSLTAGSPGVSFFQALEAMLAEDDLSNHGKVGDTVISLYRRIAQDRLRAPADVAVLWVGVNDVLARVSHTHMALKQLLRQPPARDHAEFRDYYQRIIKLLRKNTRSILAISPFLIGEDLTNPWNRALDDLCGIVASVSTPFDNVHYVDLRKRLSARLTSRRSSKYIPKSITVIAFEALFLRTPDQVDRAASRRGLHLTLDGVHLNSVGAHAIAEELRRSLVNLE